MASSPRDGVAFSFTPRTPSQVQFQEAYRRNDILLCLGPAGTGKTHCAVACALDDVLHNKRREHLVFVRPPVEAGPSLGYLKGTLDEKLAPFLAPLHHVLGKCVFKLPKDLVTCHSLGHLRGFTFENSIVVLDEAQNASYHQLKLFLTRLGHNSKLILCGDPEQSDTRPTQREYYNDLDAVADRLEGLDGVSVIDFTGPDLRHPLLPKLLHRLR